MSDPRAAPLASAEQVKKASSLVKQAAAARRVSRGVNECTKALNKGRARLVLLAADCVPLELVLHFPDLCEDKGAAYLFFPSRQELGRLCNIGRSAVAVAIRDPAPRTPLAEALDTFLAELGH